jgi:flavin-dependent dehydrogenase
MERVDLLIAGAGPSGAALACRMARRGYRVMLCDRSGFPRDKLCGEFLSPEAVAYLRRLGLDRAAWADAAPIRRAALAVGGLRPAEIDLPRAGIGLRRAVLDERIVEEARRRGALWHPRTRVARARARVGGRWEDSSATPPGRVELFRVELLAGGARRDVLARAVVNAGGRLSGLAPRGLPNGGRRGRRAVAFRRHYGCRSRAARSEWIEGGKVALFAFREGYAGVAPAGGEVVNLCFLATPERLRRAGGTAERLLAEASKENPWLRATLAELVPEGDGFISTGGIAFGPARAQAGRLLEVGDAGGMIAPAVGDGIAMALRSSEIAAEHLEAFLAGRAEWEAALAGYRRRRRREFGGRVRLARAMESLILRPRGGGLLLRALRAAPPVGAWLFRRTRDWASAAGEGAYVARDGRADDPAGSR